MPDYSKTIIYKLCCKNLDVKDIYVGSTCNFTRRKNKHKSDSINSNSKVYKFIRDNGNFQNWEMIMVEEYPCENIMQKFKRERYWYEELKATLNSGNPCRDIKEWYQDNKEKIKEHKKEYYQGNKEKFIERTKKYLENNKEKVKEYRKETDKKYYEANKDKISQRRRGYREKNRDNINQKQREYREKNRDNINQKQREYRARKKNELLKDKV
jgi:hypothetical protein